MDKLITVNELAEMLNVSRSTILRLRSKGMPCKKIGKSVRFDLQEVKDWIETQNK